MMAQWAPRVVLSIIARFVDSKIIKNKNKKNKKKSKNMLTVTQKFNVDTLIVEDTYVSLNWVFGYGDNTGDKSYTRPARIMRYF